MQKMLIYEHDMPEKERTTVKTRHAFSYSHLCVATCNGISIFCIARCTTAVKFFKGEREKVTADNRK